MSLAKAIASGAEHRRPYRRSRVFDPSCRCHGSCPWCARNRTIATRRVREKARDELREGR